MSKSFLTVEDVAFLTHELNRAYCTTQGDDSQPLWGDAPRWQRESAIQGIEFRLANPDASPSAGHENWLALKVVEGWTYGPIKNPNLRQHPCCIPYDDLPAEQKLKDMLFASVVRVCAPFVRRRVQAGSVTLSTMGDVFREEARRAESLTDAAFPRANEAAEKEPTP